ncbi:unnamed protein product [Coregonus sp. 'balchen']|nr:unnamed protein product [Coregonus sp. 'balchen']
MCPPRVAEKIAHRQTVRIGRTMKLQCPVEGDPPPLIMWTKDGRNIHSGWMRFRVLQQALRIKDVEEEDAGTFICKATNGFGSVNINYTLIVIGESPPHPPSLIPDLFVLSWGVTMTIGVGKTAQTDLRPGYHPLPHSPVSPPLPGLERSGSNMCL